MRYRGRHSAFRRSVLAVLAVPPRSTEAPRRDGARRGGGAQLAPLVDLGRGPTVVVEYSLSRRVQSSATHKSDGLSYKIKAGSQRFGSYTCDFIGPESDHWLHLSITHSLTN